MRAFPRLGLFVLGLLALAGCATRAGADESTVPVVSAELAPEAVFTELEERLLNAPALRMRYAAVSEGAFSASLEGALRMERDRGLDLDATGIFGESPVEAYLRSDGEVLEGGNAGQDFRVEAPAALDEAVILDMTRMGILHNLARLTAGAIPDHASGGVREWVRVDGLEIDPDAEGPRPGLVALRFSVHVAGQHAADATLWLDPDTGLPVLREQLVSFPGGQMSVTESYEFSDD